MDVDALTEQALAAAARGDPAQAETICRQVLEVAPDNADAHYVLGIVEHSRGNNVEAERLLARATDLDPQAFWMYVALGQVQLALGKPERAADTYASAASLNPDSLEARAPLARVLMKLERWPEAIDALRQVVRLSPDEAEPHLLLAEAFRAVDDTSHAGVESIERALALNASLDATTRAHYAGLLLQAGDFRRAISELRQAIADAPAEAGQEEQPSASAATAAAARVHQQLLMVLNYDPSLKPQDVFDEHARWGARYADPLAPVAEDFRDARQPDRPLRVGYISPDFRQHPVAYFMRRVLECHDRNHVAPFCYDDTVRPDEHTSEFHRIACQWVGSAGRTDDQVLARIRADGIDVLVDLAGHTDGNRLRGVFAGRAAPVQVSYMGYCNTTGMRAIDWVVGDDITDPPGATQPYVERLLRLSGGFCCYAPKENAEKPNDLPATRNGFVTFGSFHAPVKLNDDVLELWAELMRRLPGARLLFWRHLLNGRARDMLQARLQAHGIREHQWEIRSDRPGTTHLSVYHSADIALDTQPWSGHTTSCHSLWMGVPYVTMLGRTHAGRMAASAVTHAGFPQFVARDKQEYLQIAADLAGDLGRLADLRRQMRDQVAASRLCDGKTFTAEWERALRDAWHAWCASCASPSA